MHDYMKDNIDALRDLEIKEGLSNLKGEKEIIRSNDDL